MIKRLINHRFLQDSFWSILALCTLNITIQLIIYPFLNHILGAEEYGNILFYLSIINIVSVSVGISVNNRRMVASAYGETQNTEYNLFLLLISIVLFPLCMGMNIVLQMRMNNIELLLFWLLMCSTTWRYYADVEFRLSLNYKRYFVYYLIISLGYLVGIFLFRAIGKWELILLPGEMAGLFYVVWKGSILKKGKL